MTIAAIDIGTNTVLLLIARVDKAGITRTIRHEQRTPRLGEDVSKNGRLSLGSLGRTIRVLSEYASLSRSHKARSIVACATSAVRDAANRAIFLEAVKRQTGLLVEVLSGREEALLTYKGAVSGLRRKDSRAAVIDVGGGSTEITFPLKGGLVQKSFDVGSVRLTEEFLHHSPPLPREVRRARQAVLEAFRHKIFSRLAGRTLIGVAGTATTLACLEQDLRVFDVSRVSGFPMTRSEITGWLRTLSGLSWREILALSPVTQGRADILTAGVLILDAAMERCGAEKLTVSERGLRYGLVLREWERLRA